MAGAEEYRVRIYFPYEVDGSIYSAYYSDRTSGTSYTLPSFLLDYSTEFSWAVNARNSEAWGDYSSSWSFTVSGSGMSSSRDRQAQLDSLMIQIDSETAIPLRVLESKLNHSEISFDPDNLPEGVRMYFRSEDGEITFFEPTP